MKLISKIVGVTLGLAMAVGVGAGVAANNGKATMLDASAGDTFERITNASDISDGDVIIIVNQDKNKAMSTTQNNNNRGYVAVTSTDDVITIPNNSTIQELVVYEGEAADEFGFYTGSGFLYAVNNNNYLRTTSDNTPASSDVTGTNAWTISASDGVFSIVNTTAAKNSDHYYIAWNGTNSIFSGYVSGQQNHMFIRRQVQLLSIQFK